MRFPFFFCYTLRFTHTHAHIHTGYRQWEQMSCIHLKKILPSLSILSPLSQPCQHNRQDRITDGSLSFFKKATKKERLIPSLFFYLAIRLHTTSTPPSLHTKLIGWKERGNGEWEGGEGWKTLCIWKCPERGVIYVCIRCRFHYGPVAQVRSFQEQRGDLIKLGLITGHTGSWETTDGGEKGCNRGRKEKKREMEAYLQPGHTHLTHRERVNCNLPSKTAVYHRQAFTWKMSGRERAEQGDIDGNKSVNICLWITVVNCEHCCLCVCLQHCFSAKMTSYSYTVHLAMHMQSLKLYMQVHACRKPRRVVWLDNHVPARDKEKVFCEKKTWAAVLHPGWPQRCSPCDWGQPGDSSLAN